MRWTESVVRLVAPHSAGKKITISIFVLSTSEKACGCKGDLFDRSH